ncbi:TPA: hypothetical protein I6715_003368 [Vibrio cholerae]|uniref:hypothetical protein n=1 Tax=Vibrio cholerae TaxID=666 RepID=UPI00115A1616|nr:hypothetical protein [Vibrio cholerae]HAT7601965.1 hypothetical protein [Vibrio cholerae O1]EGQ9333580.1 hypothetical protein [Vibrio cholerae]ELI0359996.1 hypothetical protein [Vibrio cholerae]ELL8243055.1 hypothetical protein [Vibrio cholerae]EMA7652532.1 hypothetical protein [Vibrio cholerae]
MGDSVELINVSSLAELILDSTKSLKAVAKPFNGGLLQGHLLYISDGHSQWVVSTHLSDKAKLYKRADALLKEAKKLGLSQVSFEL